MPDAPLPSQPAQTAPRYRGVPMALHWLVAALVVTQLGLGWYLNEVLPDHSPVQGRMEVLHIQIGLTLFLLVLARIAARIAWRPPHLPPVIPGWERRLAEVVHYLLYALLVIVPLTGWVLVSSRKAPLSLWGLPWPHLPGVQAWGGDNPRPVRAALKTLHIFWMIWALLIALALHVAGAIKHQFDGHPVLWRMVPFLKKPADAREPDQA